MSENNDGDFFEKIGTNLRERRSEPTTLAQAVATLAMGMETAPPPGITIDSSSDSIRNWSVSDNRYFECKATVTKLPAGLYEIIETQVGLCWQKMPINTDELIIPTDNLITDIITEFKLFWNTKHEFKKRGLLHKRGFLLWGPAGSGKTCLIRLLSQELINSLDGIILKVDHPDRAANGIPILRRIEPDRPLILLLEDMDSLIERYGESTFLSLLDGEDQIENIVVIATTNYPERLDPRLINRPSRFDKIIKIGMPNSKYREAFLKVKEPEMTEQEINKWVKASEDFSLAHLKEMIVAIKCLNQPFDEVVSRLSRMKQKPKSGSETSIGF